MAYFEDVDGQIRRMIARDLEIAPAEVTDHFRWMDHMGPEDAGWFLSEIQGHFADTELFPWKVGEEFATVGALI